MKLINKSTIAEYLSNYITHFSVEELESLIELPPAEFPFTYAFPCFRLAKFEKKSPQLIAEELKERLDLPDFLETIESSGAYLNFRINSKLVLENIDELTEYYGKSKFIGDFKPLNIIIEFPSPNTNKPLHLGHVRNILLGKTLSNIYQYIGHHVFKVNLNNDRGIHICKSMLAYKLWGNNEEPSKKSDHFVGDFYVKYSKEEENNENLIIDAKNVLKLWEEEDPETRDLWNRMNKWAFDGFKDTYQKLKISFDKEYFESDLYKKGKDIILKNVENGILDKTEDGAIIAHLKDKFNIPDKILLRSDGTSIYITQDIYLSQIKKNDFNYDKSIYIVGNEQDNYFRQLFAVLEMIGFKEDKFHFSYGMIDLPAGKMKSREGNVVDADDLIDGMQEDAYLEVSDRYPNLEENEKLRRSKIIGLAAIRFYILNIAPRTNFTFDPEKSLSFEGESGPYLLYVYARIESIMRKSEEKIDFDIDFNLLSHEKELDLIKQLNYFPEIIEQTERTYGLHLIPQYLLTLCQSFNSFYSVCKVISEDKKLEKARLVLIKCVQIVLKIGLNLLDIETLEEM